MRSAIIVDDERLARRELRAMLEESHGDTVRVVAEAESVRAAEELVRTCDADVVFLDVQLAGESGLELLDRIDPSVAVVFVTAFDQYAVRAFEVNALDYLLKPVAPGRLARAVERLAAPNEPSRAPVMAKLDYHDRLFLRLDDRMGFVKVAEIVSIASDGDYSVVRLATGRTHRARKSLRDWLARLPENAFARVHRSTIVNLEHVDRVEDWSHFSYRLYLRGVSEPVTMSRRYAGLLKR
ncbi:MAG TPA: LytTR family DNA-binding domain-containing protein [Gemmatimonadaceae bacterium]|nr:LytTR family DNA-binding domain-containing protein [Gemmatimonadaceae bacterium]